MSSGLRGATGWLLAAGVAVAAACSGNPRPPADPPPQTVSETEPAEGAKSPPPAAPQPPAVAELRPPPPQVVIEPAEPETDEQPTLAEAAQRERERRLQTGKPTVVITDANLQEHAVGQLTFMEDEAPAASADGTGAGPAAAEEGPDEQYWRDRVREIRQRWADAATQVPALEERVAELRRRFYEADDPYYRDTRIKPAWDRAIDLIAQARAEAEAHRAELGAALEEGRLAGALPGWLREGIELEPVPDEPERDTHEPGEPKIVEPGEGGGGS
ncbi:MAG: hypothetical protein ACE5EG_10850 [Thermoanaerobaculia bacterium]